QKWYAHLAEAMQGRATGGMLNGDLTACRAVGSNLLSRTFYAFRWQTANPTSLPIAMRTLFSSFDSRIQHREALAPLVQQALDDLKLTEELCNSLYKQSAGQTYTKTWCADQLGNTDLLFATLHAPNITPSVREDIASKLSVRKDIP